MWMSIRFFVKIPFDVHNAGMATDRHQAPSYPLRMPDQLKSKVQSAAEKSGRSLHAELLHRIETSFAAEQKAFVRELNFESNASRARADHLTLRMDMLKARSTNLEMRILLVGEQSMRMTKAAKTDVEFAEAEAKIKELDEVEAEIETVLNEWEKLRQERVGVLAQLDSLIAISREAEVRIQAGIDAYVSRKETKSEGGGA